MTYVHKEYPKRLHFPGKPSVRVLSAEEEAAAHAEHGNAPKAPKPHKAEKAAAAPSGVDRKALVAKAKAAGVKKANFLKTEELIKLVG